ncbi:probable receptor-like protein kinase At1g33260 [Sesamum indicum]|uniref:Probable receptor-like protein kinase At1g33260 n=1 Tax=Sesamum indicum TaxID=4182 RepID=A0A6I9T9X9_SESIN|nr:probable receptor-like protein kinase At1g33260 [Sesamum indicum]
MGFVKFLKFLKLKVRCKRVADRVASVDHEEDAGDARKQICKGMPMLFSWDDIERCTMDFSLVIGYGGFSTVYLAQFPDSSSAAVKIQCSSERLNEAYKQELEILLHVHHPNIVKLLGHCDDRDEGVLVMEYVPNGNLQEKLHGSNTLLPWKKRMAIAFQLAQAIEYLHDKCGLQIVHGDIKASNILLDEQLNCKLCDFGSAKMGFSSLVLQPSSPTARRNRIMMLGSPGYTDPHYLRTGLATKKNDVYSFGVIVLELITGMEAFNPSSGERLTTKVELLLRNLEKVGEIVDPRLRGDFDLEEAKAMASLSAMCLCDIPSLRPCASDILATMRNKIPSVC